jgi:hypothetical protein
VCLVQGGVSPDPIGLADDKGVADSAAAILDSGNNLTRPAAEAKTAIDTDVSVVTATRDGAASGLCRPCAPPNRVARSQIENGAVNGTMTRTTSHEAKTFRSMALNVSVASRSKARATSRRTMTGKDCRIYPVSTGRRRIASARVVTFL